MCWPPYPEQPLKFCSRPHGHRRVLVLVPLAHEYYAESFQNYCGLATLSPAPLGTQLLPICFVLLTRGHCQLLDVLNSVIWIALASSRMICFASKYNAVRFLFHSGHFPLAPKAQCRQRVSAIECHKWRNSGFIVWSPVTQRQRVPGTAAAVAWEGGCHPLAFCESCF